MEALLRLINGPLKVPIEHKRDIVDKKIAQKKHFSEWLLFLPFLVLYTLYIWYNSAPELSRTEMHFWAYAFQLSRGYYSIPNDLFISVGPSLPAILSPFAAFEWDFTYARMLNGLFVYLGLVFTFKTLKSYCAKNWSLLLTGLLGLHYTFLGTHLAQLSEEPFCFFLIAAFCLTISNLFRQKTALKLWQMALPAFLLATIAMTKLVFGYVILTLFLLGFVFFFFTKKDDWLLSSKVLAFALIFCIPYLTYTFSKTGKLFYWANTFGASLYWMSSSNEGEFGDVHPFPGNYDPFEWHDEISYPRNVDPFYQEEHADLARGLIKFSPVKKDEKLKDLAFRNIRLHPEYYANNLAYNTCRLMFDFPYSQQEKNAHWLKWIPNILILFAVWTSLFHYRSKYIPIAFELKLAIVITTCYLTTTVLLATTASQFYMILPVLFWWLAIVFEKTIKDEIIKKERAT